MEYQEPVDNNMFTINPFMPYRVKGFYNPSTGDIIMQPWFPYEHPDNMIGYLYYEKVGARPHKFIADAQFGGVEYNNIVGE